ncbi:hypothetical protein V0R37_15080 [Pollutimonas sp. H1-120]|uniref:hypothetical protein n=1 Tax=Pollutimonas sp. H1-120 TaxID=3148824 RepID=UPI003B52A204
MNFKYSIVAAAAVLGGAVAPGTASAYTKCTITAECLIEIRMAKNEINRNIDDFDRNTTRAIDTARSDIIDALGRQTSSLSGQQSKAVETQNRHAEDVAIAREKIAIEKSSPQLQCNVASGSKGPRSGGVDATAYAGAGGAKSGRSNVPDQLKTAWNRADPASAVPAPPDPQITRVDVGAGSCAGFAGDPSSARGMMCSQINGLKINSSPFFDADIKAETLFDGPQKPGAARTQLTVTAKDKTAERDARNAALFQLSAPLPPPGISKQAVSTDAGVAYVGELTAYQAQVSLASKPARDYDALTTSNAQTKDALQVLLRDPTTAGFVTTRLDESFKNWKSEGVSAVELLDLEVEKRVGNEDWFKFYAGATDVEKAAEIPLILAAQQRMIFQLLQEVRKANVIAGQQLALQLQQTSLPKLEALAQAANGKPAQVGAQAQ